MLHKHPLHAPVKKSIKVSVKRHHSPLHTLTSIFGTDSRKFKKILPVCTYPSKRSSQATRIDIPANKDESKRADTNATEEIKDYSDSSAHSSKVSAAALRQEGKPDCTLKFHLGTTAQHTVYKAELMGMILGLHLIKTERQGTVQCMLNVDNQAALVIIKSKMTKSRQHLAADLHQIASKLHKHRGNNRFRLTFRWTARHVGINGNEEADKLAKDTADGRSLAKEALSVCLCNKIGYSLTAVQQAHNEKLKHRWAASWTSLPRYLHSQYQCHDPSHGGSYMVEGC